MARRKNIVTETKPGLLPRISFDEAIEIYLKEQKIKNRTHRTIQWHVENFNTLKKFFIEQNVPLDLYNITSKHLKDNFILYSLEQKGNIPSTINNRLKTYKSFWCYMVNSGYLKHDIAKNIVKMTEKKKIIPTLDENDINKMFKVCNKKTYTGQRDLTIMKTLLDTGLRLRETVLLKICDIYWKDNLLKADGKGQKERLIPLSNELKKTLKDYIAERGGIDVEELFVTLDNKPLSRRTVQERIEIISKKANLTKQSSPHVWRHTFAKLYVINGGDPLTLKKILGYSDWAMVHRYVDMFSSELITQHEKASPLKNL